MQSENASKGRRIGKANSCANRWQLLGIMQPVLNFATPAKQQRSGRHATTLAPDKRGEIQSKKTSACWSQCGWDHLHEVQGPEIEASSLQK